MKYLIILLAACGLTSCTMGGYDYTYTTNVIYQTRGTANWVDTNYRSQWQSNRTYKVGDTLKGIDRDQIVMVRTYNK